MKNLFLGLMLGVWLSVACSMGSKHPEYVERRENKKMWEFAELKNGNVAGDIYNQTCADPKQKKDEKCKDFKVIKRNVCTDEGHTWFKTAGYVVLPWDFLKL